MATRQGTSHRASSGGQGRPARRPAQSGTRSRQSAARSSARRAGQTRTTTTRRRGAAPVGTNPYLNSSSGRKQARRGSNNRRRAARRDLTPILGAIVVLGVVAIVALLVLHPWNYKVTVNGEQVTVKRNATIADVIEAGYANPKPGDLMAIDGELEKEGGGDKFAAVVNGEATNDPEFKIPKKAEVEISDGADTTEKYTESEQVVPHGQRTLDAEMGSYWTGSLHVYEKGEDGVITTRVGKVSGKTVTEQTKNPVDSGYHIYTCDPGEDKVIALTFDDGPWPDTTDAILDVLEENGAKATFFTIGNQISSYPEQVKREHALGCQVATHTWDHADGSGQGVNITYMSSEEQIQEVQKGYQAIAEVLGEEPSHVLRAPGGNYYGDTITTLERYVDAEVGWDLDTEDWRLPGADAISERIMSVKPGQVILMHDGGGDRNQTVEAVRRAVPELVAQGYKLVTVDDLLAYGSPAPSNGVNTVG